MTLKKILIVLNILLTITLVQKSIAQDMVLRPVVPPAPNVAALGKFIETPVSLYTGIPNISIPVYEIFSGRLKLPIALNYHAGGIRVEESASWVGLGWSLSGGGMITRTLRGRPDDDIYNTPGGYFKNSSMSMNRLIQGPGGSASIDSVHWYYQQQYLALNRQTDGEPDVFQLNVAGLNCKFYYNQEQKRFVTSPASKMQISFSGTDMTTSTFRIVTADGIAYVFSDVETTTVPWDLRVGETIISSWMLTSIEDLRTHKAISFQYVKPVSSTEYINGVSELAYYPVNPSGNTNHATSSQFVLQSGAIKQLRLAKILFSEGEVVFNLQQSNRLDMPSDTALKFITVKNKGGDEIRKCELKTSYFSGGGMSIPPPNGNALPAMYGYRLKLDSVLFTAPANNNPSIYKFNYNEQMVNRVSLDQDRWGFYNAANNLHLIDDEYIAFGSSIVHLEGGNRNANPVTNQMGILNRITYPTGGSTDFEYETNTYSVMTPSGGNYQIQPQSIFLYPGTAESTMYGVHAYSETTFSINGPSPCGGGSAGYVWGEIIQLNNSVEFCPDHLKHASVIVKGTDVSNAGVEVELTGSLNQVNLPAGNYKLILDIEHCYAEYFAEAKAVLHITDCIATDPNATFITHYTGGLRVKSIVNHDNATAIATRKTYDYSVANIAGFSSGSVPAMPYNNYTVNKYEGEISAPELSNDYYKRQSYSNIPLATTKGSSTGYSRVTETEWNGAEKNGFTVYQFTDMIGYPDISEPVNEFPYKPRTSRDEMRGELLMKEVYAIRSGVSHLVKKITNEYVNILDTTYGAYSFGFTGAVRMGGMNKIFEGVVPYNDVMTTPPQLGVYKEVTDMLLLAKTVETTVDASDETKYIETVTRNRYSPLNLQIMGTATFTMADSTNKKINELKYPIDYFQNTSSATDNYTQALKNLIEANLINEPVEKSTYIEKAGIKKLLSGQLNLYDGLSLSPKQIDRLETNQPLTPVILSENSGGTFVKNANLKPVILILAYDLDGNILEQQKKDDVVQSYLWNYGNNLPVSETKGASYASISYSSFESDGLGNWDYVSGGVLSDATAVTGGKVYNLSVSNIQRTGLNSGMGYMLTYWLKDGSGSVSGGGTALMSKNGWTLYRQEITGVSSLTLSGSGTIDELRLYPKEAQMTTYTYKPLVGMTSQCDANNRITYYEYDGFGRLQRIKDQDGNILKAFDYKYQQ